MRRVAFVSILVLFFSWAVCAQQLLGFQPGTFTGRAALDASGSPPPSYTGPGDVVSGAVAWWGLRCYNAAYTGNVADVWDAATGNTTETLLTCSSGGTINQTVHSLSVTCAVSCVIATIYDQSGANSCSGSACDAIQATNANRPVFSNGATFSAQCSSGLSLAAANLTPQAQPLTLSSVFERTGTFTAFNIFYASTNGSVYAGLSTSANQFEAYAGSPGDVTANDSAMHAIQVVYNDASSTINIDGSSTAEILGPSGIATGHTLCRFGSDGDYLTGNLWEVGLWPVAFSGGQISAMNSNQHSYWGF